MLTEPTRGPGDARKFVLRGVGATLGLFGLLRLPWTEAHVVLPITRLQAGLATSIFGTAAAPVEATLACSGADATALCLGAILAYPAPWSRRLAGAGCGVALIAALNTVRIGTLGRAAASPASFEALHVFVWPAVLTLAIAGYVLVWMRLVDRAPAATPRSVWRFEPSRRFVLLAVALLLLFSALSSFYRESPPVVAAAGLIARVAATTLDVVGVSAYADANVLRTRRGGFLVTGECIATPLIPIYLAALWVYVPTWKRRLLGVLATAPLFIALGIVRLLLVALPDAVASPLFFVHAFYQFLLGAVIVVIAAVWRHGRAAPTHALAGIAAGVVCMGLLGPVYAHVLASPIGPPAADPQGAVTLLPAFQAGLYLALCIAAFVATIWKRLLCGFGVLALTQAASLIAMSAIAGYAGVTAQVRDVRGWAIAGPVLVFALMVNVARPRR